MEQESSKTSFELIRLTLDYINMRNLGITQTWAHAVENFRIYQYYLEGAENIQHNFSKISTTFYLSDSNFSKY